jgi:hypothetical protein
MSQSVRFAGLALACLYMTVLGFDNITIGRFFFSTFSLTKMFGFCFEMYKLLNLSAFTH